MCQPQYESSVADADILISAKVIKVTTTHPTASTFWSPGQVQAGGRRPRDAVPWRSPQETMHGHQHSGEEPQQQRRLWNSSSVAIFSPDKALQAFQTALELATDEARERCNKKLSISIPPLFHLCSLYYLFVFTLLLLSIYKYRFEAIGTRLIFSDDNDPGWGPGESFRTKTQKSQKKIFGQQINWISCKNPIAQDGSTALVFITRVWMRRTQICTQPASSLLQTSSSRVQPECTTATSSPPSGSTNFPIVILSPSSGPLSGSILWRSRESPCSSNCPKSLMSM